MTEGSKDPGIEVSGRLQNERFASIEPKAQRLAHLQRVSEGFFVESEFIGELSRKFQQYRKGRDRKG